MLDFLALPSTLLVHKTCLYILGYIACIFNRGVNASKANPIKVALSYCTSITEQTTAKSYVFLRYCTAKPVVRKLYWQQLFLERASSMCSRFCFLSRLVIKLN